MNDIIQTKMGGETVRVGDRLRITTEMLREIHVMPRHTTVDAEVATIERHHDGTVTIWLRSSLSSCDTCAHMTNKWTAPPDDVRGVCELLGIVRPVTFRCSEWRDRLSF